MDPGGRVRTRKISQTDNVDMWDATDPTGQNWHHESPYDIGGMGERNGSPDGEVGSPAIHVVVFAINLCHAESNGFQSQQDELERE